MLGPGAGLVWGRAASAGSPVPLASSLPPDVPGCPAEPARGQPSGQPDGGQRAPGARRCVRVREHGGRQVPRAGEDRGAPRLLQPHCQGLAGCGPALGGWRSLTPMSSELAWGTSVLIPAPPLGSCGV